jgi:hypothetical protein
MNSCMVLGQWGFLAHDRDEVYIPQFSDISSRNYVGCGVITRHVLAVKGVGSVKFQLELGGYLELDKVLYVLELLVKFISLFYFETDGCGIVLSQGNVYLYPKGIPSNPIVLLGVWLERL